MSIERRLPLVDERPPERADAARNRLRILTAARDLLDDCSPCALSIDAVAAAAGVGKGTVYRRFGDRAGLIQALLDERERSLQQQVLSGCPPLGPGATPLVRLQAFLSALVEELEVISDLRAEVEAGQHWLANPPYQFRRLHVRVLIAQADPTLDADVLADLLLAPLAAGTFRHQRQTAGYDAARITEALCTLAAGLIER